ncbi:MAG: PQQ-like beta-propeller repeat protein [Bacteroidota bacterium]|nr:PQQ-like beta-propeller repeat protein [Bacteroidota bacterium]
MLIIRPRVPLLALIFVIFFSCKKSTDPAPNTTPPITVVPKPVYSKTITKFVFRQSDNHFVFATDSLATIGTDSVTINMPGGTDLTKLIPTIEIAGKSIQPASGTPQDFTNPITYTVSDSAGATKNYIVKINLSGAGEIIIAENSLYAYDATTAQLRWNTPDYKNIYYSAVVTDGKLVFSYGGSGVEYAQDIITGTLVWSKSMAGSIRTPAISKGILYLPGNGQNMTALDAATGNQIWSKYYYLDNRFQAMNITNDILYFVAQQDNRVYSVNALNGNLNWQSDPSLVFVATPTVSGNSVYASAYD